VEPNPKSSLGSRNKRQTSTRATSRVRLLRGRAGKPVKRIGAMNEALWYGDVSGGLMSSLGLPCGEKGLVRGYLDDIKVLLVFGKTDVGSDMRYPGPM